MGGCVPTFIIKGAYCLGRHVIEAEDLINHARFPDTRRANKGGALAWI